MEEEFECKFFPEPRPVFGYNLAEDIFALKPASDIHLVRKGEPFLTPVR